MQFDNPGTNPFLDTEDDNLSTFAMDVDTGSYTVARSYLMGQNQLPPDEAIRPEEFINYFDAGYESPEDDSFAIYLDAAPAPFGYDGHYLLRVGIQGKYINPEDRTPALLIFVIDVSGSMDMENRLGLVKEALGLLTGELREDDRVGIVVYSDQSRSVLDPTPASETETIMTAINNLHPEGSTNVEDGLRLGYAMAEEYMREGEITRVITLSDGVANVGSTGPDAILQTIHAGVDDGITLSTIGFGMGNYNDVLMEQLANDGNGNYYYVDTLHEAERIFVHNLTGTLQVIGYDAKIQVEFNPDVTDRYRLIGYENRAIADEDFRNDTVDAGEVGAGQTVTALYELALEDGVDNPEDVVATVYIRYQDADTREVVEVSESLTVSELMDNFDDAPATFRLQAAVAEFAELLRGSFWAEDGNFGAVMSVLRSLEDDLGDDENFTEFEQLVSLATRYQDR
jgi:Ca-activated chloride channel family protein